MVTTISYDAWVSRRHHTGTVVRSTVYDIWGSVRTTSGTVDTRLGYTGELMGAVDGTVYLRARHYRPALGRFTQRVPERDTFAGIPTSPQSLHKYTYTHNNPIRYTDPSGHLAFIPLILAAAPYVVAGFEIRLSIYDAYETGKTLFDPCASLFEKGATVGLFVVGIFMPGGGSTAGGKAAARNVDSAANYAARHVDDVDVVDDVQAIYKVTDNIDDARDANNAATTIDDADTIKKFDDLPCVPNSFVAGTLVESSDGLVPIETLAEGDLVWAVDPETGAAGWYPITWTTKHEDADIVTLSVTLLGTADEALSSTQERTVVVTITATLEHPFWVEGIGWIDAGDLEAGDVLLSADGRRLVVQAAVRSAGPAMVYNFTVDALHTYTVTELRVVVHNVENCFERPLTIDDLGLSAEQVLELKGTFSVQEGQGKVFIDMIRTPEKGYGPQSNPFKIMKSLSKIAKEHGANHLRIEGYFANPRFMEVIGLRYPVHTDPTTGMEFIELLLVLQL